MSEGGAIVNPVSEIYATRYCLNRRFPRSGFCCSLLSTGEPLISERSLGQNVVPYSGIPEYENRSRVWCRMTWSTLLSEFSRLYDDPYGAEVSSRSSCFASLSARFVAAASGPSPVGLIEIG
jgi:hypothetical protein